MKKNHLPVALEGNPCASISYELTPNALDKWDGSIKAASTDNTISILDVIGEDYWGEGVTTKRIAAALRAIGDNDVVVNINSPGGNMFEGLAIYNQLRAHSGKVTVNVLGIAASAASIIAMAGDEIQMGRGAFLMIHNCWGVCIGNRHDLAKLALDMEPFDKSMCDIYMARSGQASDAISQMMDNETYIGANDAIEKGFADSLLSADVINDGDESPQAAIRKLDALLAKSNTPRAERRKLISALTGSTPGATSHSNGTPSATSEINPETLSELEKAVSAFSVKRDGLGLTLQNINDNQSAYYDIKDKEGVRRALIGYGGADNTLSILNSHTGYSVQLAADGILKYRGNAVLLLGDFGVGGKSQNLNGISDANCFISYSGANDATPHGFPTNGAGMQSVYAAARRAQIFQAQANGKFYSRFSVVAGADTTTAWNEHYTTANTTKDSNGNLKAASPIVKLFADDIELNEESEGVEMEHLGVGHYLIKGVVGFNADGAWGINNGFVIPQDHNGKNMVLIDYEVRPDGDIEVFVFHQQNADMPERFQNKRIKHFDEEGAPVYFENYEACDVPESRWIDMRVEMPPNSLYNQKQAEAERLAKLEAERLAKEEAERIAEEAERAEQEATTQAEEQ